ncbi:hypothetical protein QUF63_15085 [Anaerolineales bacterium HSG25]|nr:hypothetical protein [Anaerolineales bacterium HSG25]
MQTLEKLKRLEQYILLDQTAIDPVFDMTLEKLLHREFNRVATLKARLVKQLQTFEKQYHLKSQEFYPRYENGELGDEIDFMEWASTIEMVNNINQRLTVLNIEPVS